MPVSLVCACGKRLRAKDELAGKRVKCPGCGNPLVVPAADEAPSEEPEPEPQPEAEESSPPRTAPPRPQPSAAALDRYKGVLAERPARSWREYTYWALLLALVPLGFSLMAKEGASPAERLDRTIEKAPREARQRIALLLDSVEEGKADPEELFAALPGGRIEGAHLPRRTFVHFLYALLAAAGFLVLAYFLVPSEDGRPLPVLLIGLFTATIGIGLLFLAQLLAEVTQGRILISANIVVLLLFYIAWLIGFSYRAALDPDMGFVPSLLGYTFGVGLCEEVCKALPLIWYYRSAERPDWRLACTWGFASGAGFGVAEAIMYSGDQYNGIAPGGIYVVRFVSCIALHAIWSAAVALFIHRHQRVLQGELRWYDYIPRTLFLVAIPMVLHGLYDTALKKDMNVLALVTALVSFAWLVWCIERARATEGEAADKPGVRYA